ncbi:MAG: flavodoxin-dependent (E)-4-hydroxy-3-methylbut-2-enyl-diphosphate synthase [Ruminococcaceae bacterium]|nr:flavodoxin-dependent (E)-4-hydroxy-3-methylbut-2-enyl-diphosphate synthase [Oscillospiraceae bacterium]
MSPFSFYKITIYLQTILCYNKTTRNQEVIKMERRVSKQINVGGVLIGGNAPISVQSMCNTDTRDISATVNQINELKEAGCDIVRLAVLDMEAAKAVAEIKKQVEIPLVADIHFDYRLALECAKGGVDKIRINPGNIGSPDRVKAVADECGNRNIPIRIGVNGGSLEKEILEKHGAPTPDALCESALGHIKLLEDCKFYDIALSIKSSNVSSTVEAYRKIAKMIDYPLHIGVTEAGTEYGGVIKNSIGIGSLLLDGIGDTLRVSLTAPPVKEVTAGIEILKSLGLRDGARLVSCPTCGRCRVNMIPIADEVNKRLATVNKNITVAVMGCAVNGPGEAREADIGIACGKGEALMFKYGEILRKVPIENAADELMKEIEEL